MRVRVLVLAGDSAARAGLRRLIAADQGVEVVAEAQDAAEAVLKVRKERPDVILLDGVPGEGSLDAMRRVLAEAPQGRALVLSSRDDPEALREAFEAGASGYLLHSADADDVVAAVRALGSGSGYVDPSLAARALAELVQRRAPLTDGRLTKRQSEVLRLLALGHTNQEIADSLVLSVRTVETHRAHIMQKLRITSRAELVRYALERGLLAA